MSSPARYLGINGSANSVAGASKFQSRAGKFGILGAHELQFPSDVELARK